VDIQHLILLSTKPADIEAVEENEEPIMKTSDCFCHGRQRPDTRRAQRLAARISYFTRRSRARPNFYDLRGPRVQASAHSNRSE
jgi:hypothetical protein